MIDLLTPFVNEKGNVIEAQVPKTVKKDGKEIEKLHKETLTLKKVIRESMLSDVPQYRHPKIMKKRFDVYMKIKDVNEIILTRSEKRLIEKFAAMRFDVLIIGQLINILND